MVNIGPIAAAPMPQPESARLLFQPGRQRRAGISSLVKFASGYAGCPGALLPAAGKATHFHSKRNPGGWYTK